LASPQLAAESGDREAGRDCRLASEGQDREASFPEERLQQASALHTGHRPTLSGRM